MKAPALLKNRFQWGTSGMVPAIAAVISALVLVIFLVGTFLNRVSPNSTLGMAFGVGALLCLLLVMTYSMRRSAPANRRLGATQWYLQLHLWGGAVFLVMFLSHTSFRLPGGLLYFALWAVTWWVGATGVVGVLLQRSLPRILEPSASLEVNLHRIPELVDELRGRAEAAAAAAEPRIKTHYDQHMAPDMAGPRMVTSILFRSGGSIKRRTGESDVLRRTLDPTGIASLDTLSSLQATKNDLDLHYTLQRILRGWLILHLPVAIVLLGLVILHLFLILYY